KILLENLGKAHQLKNFYIRRSLRIFPVYYFTLLTLFVALPLLDLHFHWLDSEINNQAWFWTYLNNWIRPFIHIKTLPHLWSLAIEEQYYLVWPFVVIFLRREWLFRVCVFMICSAPISRYLLFYFYQPEIADLGAKATYNYTFARWDALAMGSLMAVILSDPQSRQWISIRIKLIFATSVFMIIVQLFLTRTFNAVGQGGYELMNQTSSAILFSSVLYFVINSQSGRSVKYLELSLVKLIGKYSYAMYIFHLPLMIIWFKYFSSEIYFIEQANPLLQLGVHFFAIFLVTFTLSALSWHMLEHPILKLKRRFS
ncbi:MAG: acyltransferase, partial [Kangiellaceae bacterium]|nr:acyltransferase [Kangiellaceae bacterium]